jgi:hypothetical protein
MHCKGVECPLSFYTCSTSAKGPKVELFKWTVYNIFRKTKRKSRNPLLIKSYQYVFHPGSLYVPYFIKYSVHFLQWKWCWNIPCALYIEGSWERVLKGFYNELARIISCEIILKNKNKMFLPKIIVKFRCALYLYAQ